MAVRFAVTPSPRLIAPVVLTMLVLGTVAGCGGRDTAPPVASVTVKASKDRVPIGSPVDFTYRFEKLPDTPIDDDYRVFVQVKDTEGNIVFSDDHLPPTPTSRWQPGQVVEYTRTVFIPPMVAAGDVSINCGLYLDGRLPLRGPDEADRDNPDRSYRVAGLRIAPESERLFLIYRTGWYGDEFTDNAADAWRWTQPSAVLAFENPHKDLVLYLDYDARPDFFPDGPQVVTITAGTTPVQTFKADTQERRLLQVPIPAEALGTDSMSELRIDVDKAFVPANLPAGGKDNRTLGLRVYHAVLESR